MGCDINIYLEYRSPITNDWEPFGYGYSIPRNYDMFAKMAVVRAEKYNTIFQARGLPDDLSEYVKEMYDKIPDDYLRHNPSWLNKNDFEVCVLSYDSSDISHIIEYKVILSSMSMFEEYNIETRIVFWFML